MVREWHPVFRIQIGMSRTEMLDMSIPELVDMLDAYREMTRDG